MIGNNEIEVRTDERDILICTAEIKENGQVDIIGRKGKKEDRISVDRFLSKIYGRSVMVISL